MIVLKNLKMRKDVRGIQTGKRLFYSFLWLLIVRISLPLYILQFWYNALVSCCAFVNILNILPPTLTALLGNSPSQKNKTKILLITNKSQTNLKPIVFRVFGKLTNLKKSITFMSQRCPVSGTTLFAFLRASLLCLTPLG